LFVPNPKLKLQQQVHEVMRFFHYSPRTEETYWHWIRRFMVWAKEHSRESTPHPGPLPGRGGEGRQVEKRWVHPRELGADAVAEFLSSLATEGNVAAATQNQAL